MKTLIQKLFLALAWLALLAIGNLAHSANITWTNTSGGKWSVAANWSPNQVPGTNDSALITQLGTYTVVFDVSSYSGGNYVYYPSIVSNLTVGVGTSASGVQTLLITNLSPYSHFQVNNLLLITNGGIVTMTNGYLGANPLTIDKGGVFNGSSEGIVANVMVANGGWLNSVYGHITQNNGQGGYPDQTLTLTNGGTLDSLDDTIGGTLMIANGGIASVQGGVGDLGFTVEHGGVLVITNGLTLYGPLINSGMVNLTNGVIHFINNVYQGGGGSLLNLPGGVINLHGNGSIIAAIGQSPGYYFGYVINQGAIVQTGGTNSISAPVFDNTAGAITNLSGLLTLGFFPTNLAGTYNAASGAAIQFSGGANGAPVALGTPFVLGGGGQFQFAGYLYLTATLPANLEIGSPAGTGVLQLSPSFQGGAITNLILGGAGGYAELLNTLPVTGTLTGTNLQIDTNLLITSSGVFNVSDTLQYWPLINAVAVSHGGTMNVTGPISLRFPITNAGTLNLNESLVTFDVYSPSPAGIVNQPGGLINMIGAGGISASSSADYFINQGTVVQNAGAGATNSISYQAFTRFNNGVYNIGLYPYQPFQFDNSQGTITNLSGTLILPSFQSTLAGTFYAAAGATIQLGGGTTNAPLVPGTPLMLGGSGQYQFISGYLYLPANAIPNLSLQGGQLTLGAGFQGGAITNLTLAGITFSNQFPATLAINGTFSIINSGIPGTLNSSLWAGFYGNGVYGNYTVAGGGILNVSNAVMYGTVTVGNGGVLNANGALMNGVLTVASGGLVNAIGGGGTINSGGSLTVTAGGTINVSGSDFTLYGPLNNAGTINVSNPPPAFRAVIWSYNDGSASYRGGIINQASGLINLGSDSTYLSTYGGGHEYIVNQGTIIKSAGTNLSAVVATFVTNSGAIIAKSGVIGMGYYGPASLQPGSSLNVVLYNATNYTKILFQGPAPLGGALNVTLANGYVPTNGTSFNVVSYGSFTGNFTSLGLPAAVSWQSNYGSTNFSLVAGSGLPQFGIVNLSGTNLIFNGTGGLAGSNYVMLASTNLALPLTNWTALATNIFGGSGQFHYTNPVSPAKPRQFFIFKRP